jgi:uncharacterized membrane protein
MMLLAHLPALAAAFFASLVEFVEALTVVLAVGAVRGWLPAMTGAFGALAVLGLIVLVFGAALTMVPLHAVQLLVGVLLVAFGWRWLSKAVKRAAGMLPLRDENALFARQCARLRGLDEPSFIDGAAIVTSFSVTMIEGIEIVLIVLALGAGAPALLPTAMAGAAFALGLVMLAGLLLHRPLAKLPENTMKFGTAAVLLAFGVFWLGEGAGYGWPGDEASLLGLIAVVLVAATAAVALLRTSVRMGQEVLGKGLSPAELYEIGGGGIERAAGEAGELYAPRQLGLVEGAHG